MRILSWNLWWRYGPWQRRREAIAATLAEIGPDVCGLQEVWGASEENLAAELAERLGMHWCWAAAASERDGQILLGNAILSRWPIAAQAQPRLPDRRTSAEGRVALHARIDAPGGALPMFTTHLTYGLGRHRSAPQQVRLLAEFVAGQAADCDYPPVVTGDLNAEPGSDELRLLGGLLTAPEAPGLVLVDAWRYADPGRSRLHLGPPQRLPGPHHPPGFADRLRPGRPAPAGPRPGAIGQAGRHCPGGRRLALGSFRRRRRAPAVGPGGMPIPCSTPR